MVGSTTYVSKVVVHAPTLLQSTGSQPRSVSVVKERVVGDSLSKSGFAFSLPMSKSQTSLGIKENFGLAADLASEKCASRVIRTTLSELITPNADTGPSTPQSCFSSTSTIASSSQLPTPVQRTNVDFRFQREQTVDYQELHSAAGSNVYSGKDFASLHSSTLFTDLYSSIIYSASAPSAAAAASTSYSSHSYSMNKPSDTAGQPSRVIIQTLREPASSARSSSKGAPAATRAPQQASITRQCRQHEPTHPDTANTGGMPSSRKRGLEVDTVNLYGRFFDPAQPLVRRQLAVPLRILDTAQVEALQGHRGGLNDGIWFVRSHDGELVFKLVAGTSAHPAVPTEAESLMRIAKAHPSIVNDPDLAFPHHVLRLQGCSSGKPRDLIVARRAQGSRLQEVMSQKLQSSRHQELLAIFETVGALVARFHCRYGHQQHGDLTAANIMYDESSGRATLIDLGGMGDPQIRVKDVDHFPKSVELLTKKQDPSLAGLLFSHFQLAYNRAMNGI